MTKREWRPWWMRNPHLVRVEDAHDDLMRMFGLQLDDDGEFVGGVLLAPVRAAIASGDIAVWATDLDTRNGAPAEEELSPDDGLAIVVKLMTPTVNTDGRAGYDRSIKVKLSAAEALAADGMSPTDISRLDAMGRLEHPSRLLEWRGSEFADFSLGVQGLQKVVRKLLEEGKRGPADPEGLEEFQRWLTAQNPSPAEQERWICAREGWDPRDPRERAAAKKRAGRWSGRYKR